MNALLYILNHNKTDIHAPPIWKIIYEYLKANTEKVELEDEENNPEYSVYQGKIRDRTRAGHIVEFSFFVYAGVSEKTIFPEGVKIMSISCPKSDHQKELFYNIANQLCRFYQIYYQNDDYFDGIMKDLDESEISYELKRLKRK